MNLHRRHLKVELRGGSRVPTIKFESIRRKLLGTRFRGHSRRRREMEVNHIGLRSRAEARAEAHHPLHRGFIADDILNDSESHLARTEPLYNTCPLLAVFVFPSSLPRLRAY